MLYDVRLRIAYQYAAPAASSRHLVRLLPRTLPDLQRPIATELSVHPVPNERGAFADFFGNQVQEVFLRPPHGAVEFRVQGRIERLAPPTPRNAAMMSNLAAELQGICDLTQESPQHYLGETRFVRPSRYLKDYTLDLLPPDADVADAVRLIGEAINKRMTFDPGATVVTTPHEEAFEKKRGVCQDFTHIMIACLRSVGIPAGYVSGLLRTLPPQGMTRLSGADQMHAWVRAWCGKDAGWFEYDPTNAVDARADHICIARGRDYFDVSPVKGVLRSAGAQASMQQIDVIEVDTAA
jgi:transglutaminase-like putative cysteine protease